MKLTNEVAFKAFLNFRVIPFLFVEQTTIWGNSFMCIIWHVNCSIFFK